MEERDYTGHDHESAGFSVRALFPRYVLIEFAVATVSLLTIFAIALSGSLDSTGFVYVLLLIPAHFTVSGLLSILMLAIRQGANRAEDEIRKSCHPGRPIQAVGSALFLFVVFLIVAGYPA